MKKRLIGILLCLTILLSLMPTVALADSRTEVTAVVATCEGFEPMLNMSVDYIPEFTVTQGAPARVNASTGNFRWQKYNEETLAWEIVYEGRIDEGKWRALTQVRIDNNTTHKLSESVTLTVDGKEWPTDGAVTVDTTYSVVWVTSPEYTFTSDSPSMTAITELNLYLKNYQVGNDVSAITVIADTESVAVTDYMLAIMDEPEPRPAEGVIESGTDYILAVRCVPEDGYDFYDLSKESSTLYNAKQEMEEHLSKDAFSGIYFLKAPISEHVCTLKRVPEKQATCEEKGQGEYYACSVCGDAYQDEEGNTPIDNILTWNTTPARGHNMGYKYDRFSHHKGCTYDDCDLVSGESEPHFVDAFSDDLGVCDICKAELNLLNVKLRGYRAGNLPTDVTVTIDNDKLTFEDMAFLKIITDENGDPVGLEHTPHISAFVEGDMYFFTILIDASAITDLDEIPLYNKETILLNGDIKAEKAEFIEKDDETSKLVVGFALPAAVSTLPEYIVAYSPNGGGGTMIGDVVEEGGTFTLEECSYEAPAGMRFKAWAIGSPAGEQKQPGESIVIMDETYIYPVWEEKHTVSFTDVPNDAYFFAPVNWAVENGVTNGAAPGKFLPDATCTRAHAVTFMWRAMGSPEPQSDVNPFSDVKEEAYYYKAVLWAVEQGIVNGMAPDKFAPDANCTRGQIVTMLHRMANNPAPNSDTNPFTDVKEEAYYHTAVLWAVEEGITNGAAPGKFLPDSSCTRAQIVTFLYRALV